jgi:hypothetical protein
MPRKERTVSEPTQQSPPPIDLTRRLHDTMVFLRMAAIELRRVVEDAPEMAAKLRHLAEQLEAEAEDLVRCEISTAEEGNQCLTLSK